MLEKVAKKKIIKHGLQTELETIKCRLRIDARKNRKGAARKLVAVKSVSPSLSPIEDMPIKTKSS